MSQSTNANQQQPSLWLFNEHELNMAPSICDGMLKYQEELMRAEGVKFIQRLGNRELNLHTYTVATGAVYFHRFYMYQSLKKFPIYPMAAACLFLAGKVEETPKKSNDIVRVCKNCLPEKDFATFLCNGVDPKEEILTLERILLQTLRFNLEVEHPYEHLIKYVKQLSFSSSEDIENLTKEYIQKQVTQSAWTFLNDSYCTTIYLQYEPEVIAIGMLFLAFKVGTFKVFNWENRNPNQRNWWDCHVEHLDEAILENICHKLLDVYTDRVPKASPSNPTTPNSANPITRISPNSIKSEPVTPSQGTTQYTTLPRDEIHENLSLVASMIPPPPPPPDEP